MSSSDRLIGRIYDAALDPAPWSAVLTAVSDAVGGGPANQTDLDIVTGEGWGAAVRTDPAVMERYFTHWSAVNPLALVADADAYARDWTLSVLRDDELVDRRALLRTPYLNEFLRPIEASHSIVVRLSLEGRRVRTIGVGRTDRHGRFSDAEIATARFLQPHLARADRLRRRLDEADAQAAQLRPLIERVPGALLFVDAGGTVRLASAAAEAILAGAGPLARGRAGRLVGRTPSIEAQLRALLDAAWRDPTAPEHRAALGEPPDAFGLTASIASGRYLPGLPARTMVLLECLPLAAPDPAARLRARFGLTAAEARVALALLAGESPAAIAAAAGASVHTVRSQLAAVFAKTHVHRQSELVALLGRERFGPDPT